MGRKEEDNIGVTLGEDGGPQALLLSYGSAMTTVRPISQAGKYPRGGDQGRGLIKPSWPCAVAGGCIALIPAPAHREKSPQVRV